MTYPSLDVCFFFSIAFVLFLENNERFLLLHLSDLVKIFFELIWHEQLLCHLIAQMKNPHYFASIVDPFIVLFGHMIPSFDYVVARDAPK